MKINKAMLIVFTVFVFLSISCVNAADIDADSNSTDKNVLTSDLNTINVDNTSASTINEALSIAKDNGTIILSDGVYKGDGNTKITITKSVNIIGSDNTVLDGLNKNYIFTVSDNITVTFKNLKFINAYKSPESYGATYSNTVYGAALDIKNATVTIEDCTFENSKLFYGTVDKYIYGGAISNFGDLTVINSNFINNTALSTSGLFSYGGAIYNKGKAKVMNSSFEKSQSVDFGYGAAIANDGEMIFENGRITDSRALHECKGSAIFNNGKMILTGSVIENNYIERANFNGIYGAVYNSGELTAYGNIFRNNTGFYEAPMASYKGSPNIYSVGILNLTYNAFMDNNYFEGISRDVYINAGDIISLDNNWWNTNENPYTDSSRINVDDLNSWIIFKLTPDYSKLNISESVTLKAFWTNNIDNLPQINLFPIFNATFKTVVNSNQYTSTKELVNGECNFEFTYAQNKGSYNVTADVNGFGQTAIVDVGKANTFVKFTASDNITFNENLTVDVEVTSAGSKVPTGVVLLKINGEVYTVNLTNGRGSTVISNLNPKDYVMEIIYDGDEDSFKAFNETTIHIKKQSVDLTLTIPEIKVGQKGTLITTLLPLGVQGQAIVYVDGSRKKIAYLYNGNTTIALNNFAEGEYNITLEFVETPFYYPATVSGILNVTRYPTQINITSHDINVGENATITISVSPESLRGEATLIINGVSNEIFIDDTVTNITLEGFSAGQYNVTLVFEGDLRYYPVNVSTSFNVLRTPTELTVTIDEDEKNLNGTVTVKTNHANSTGVVGVYINYEVYRMNLTNGEAQFNVKFDKGTNYIFVFYEGDEYYEEATWNTTIGVDDEFAFIGQNSTGFAYNDFNYSVRLIEVTGIPMPNRIVSVSFEGKTYSITTDDNGYAYLNINIASGEYDISATYRNSTITNHIVVSDVKFNLTASDITYGETETLKAIFDSKITGNVSFIIDNKLNVVCEIVNGSAVYNISGLDVGKYTVRAIYSNGIMNLTETAQFNIVKADVELKLDIPSSTPEADQIININGLKNATGTLIITVNGNAYEKAISNGAVILNLSKLDEGNYSVSVKYEGDGNYNPSDVSAYFYVKKFASAIELTINNAAYAEDLTANVNLNMNATGIVRFTVGDIVKDVEIKNGNAVWKFTGIDVGTYNITAEYLGNEYYVSSSNTTSFTVSRANSKVELYVKDVALDENIRIYANLSPNATGKLSFSMIGYFSPRDKPITDSTSNWYIAPLNTGEYTVIARYAGDKNYYASNTTYLLNVSQQKSVLTVDLNDVRVTERVVCRVTLNTKYGDPLTSTVTLKIGANTYDIDVNDGKGSLVIGRMAAGNYYYSVQYAGDENFTPAGISGSFKVVDDLLDATLTVSNLTKYYGGKDKLQVTLKDSNGNAFADQNIIVKLASKEYKTVTDKNGKAYIDVDVVSGNYTALVTFPETERYHGASANATVTVMSTVDGIDVVKMYGSGTQYFAIYTDSNGKALSNTKVTFTLSGKSYTITTLPNGIARVNINIKAGTYTITSKNPATGETLKNKLTIYYKIMNNKDVSNYYGAKTNYKVRIYGNDAKPVGAGKVVTFKINGKTYKIKTNKNGYATLAVKLPAKKYTVTASYNGFKVSNKITVKKVLSAKNISKKKTKTTKFKAKLVNSAGKVLKGKKITFKIDGKKYTAKTNKKGIATVTIKMTLKVGKHKIQSIYGKTKITNTITIKK